jgi:hypothetical protein
MAGLHRGERHQLAIGLRISSSGTGTLRTLPDELLAAADQNVFHQIAAERDRLRKKLAALKQIHAQAQVQIASMQSLINRLESQAVSHQCERDLAISQRSAYEALFVGIQAQLRAFETPAAPLVEQLSHCRRGQPAPVNLDTVKPGTVFSGEEMLR